MTVCYGSDLLMSLSACQTGACGLAWLLHPSCSSPSAARGRPWRLFARFARAHASEEFTVRSKILPSPTILRHATTNPARMLNMAGKLGTISPGAIADLIVLTKNPLGDITVLDRPEENLVAVVKAGRLVSGVLGHVRLVEVPQI